MLAAYLALPFDVVPDVIPVLGQLDDALLVGAVLRFVIRGASRGVAREHWPGSDASFEALLRLTGTAQPGSARAP